MATAQLGVLNSKGFDARDEHAFDIKKAIPKKARSMLEDEPASGVGVKKKEEGEQPGGAEAKSDNEDSDQQRARKRIALHERKLLKKKSAGTKTETNDGEKTTRKEIVKAREKEDLWASSSSEGADVDIDTDFHIPQPDPTPAAPAAPALSTVASLREQLLHNKQLQRAVLDANLSACEAAVASGAWVDWGDPSLSRMTALHIAVFNGCDALITHLWALGADPNVRDARGFSPLHLALMLARDSIALELTRLGARVHLRHKLSAAHRTPLELARWSGREGLEEGMKKLLAKRAEKRERVRASREREGEEEERDGAKEEEGGQGGEEGGAMGRGMSARERERRRRIAAEQSEVEEEVEEDEEDEEEAGVWEGFDAGREIREMCVRIAQSGAGKEEVFSLGMPDEPPEGEESGDGPSASDSFQPQYSD